MAYYYPGRSAQSRITEARLVGQRLSLKDAETFGLTWDVFVSHRSTDTRLAEKVASRIQECDLSVWLDSAYLHPNEDGPELASEISEVISRSFSLMAVVTDSTKDSWWVPFEIGLAFELKRYLASYGNYTELPSFLWKWPNVSDYADLNKWCRQIKRLKMKYEPSYLNERVDISDSQHQSYAIEMKSLAILFS